MLITGILITMVAIFMVLNENGSITRKLQVSSKQR